MATEEFDRGFDEPTGRPARPILIGVGVLALLGIVWFLFLRGGNEPTERVATTAPVNASSDEQAAEPVAKAKNSQVETFEIFAPKDPFDPLISAAPVDVGPVVAPETGTSLGATPTETTDPGISESEGTTTITTEQSSGSQTTASNGRRVKVVDVFTEGGGEHAQVQVDGTVYTIDEGERFAGSFELVSASNACATMLFGDDEFTLCEGEEILK
ncbi:MAG: hypothetical protein QOK47_1069 [Actinomycetota bacterium]|nr:hypothetical protein [Actinomycetota bacterium]